MTFAIAVSVDRVEVPERLQLPGLAGKPGLDSALNIGQVGHHQFLARRGDDAAPHGAAGHFHNVVVGGHHIAILKTFMQQVHR